MIGIGEPAGRADRGRRRAVLLLGTALTAALGGMAAIPAAAQADPAANARPEGGKVSAGAASIARTATATTISQSSPRAVIDWTGFDVGRQQSVTFVQPSATATTLNRVDSPNPSQIAGRISANGRIVIENRAGIVVADGAQIDANAVVLSAAGITNRAFMAGGTSFTVPARAGASVTNRGTITVREAGLAALVAPNVSNDGVIEARGGQVVLAGASIYKIDLYGDGLLSFEVRAGGEATSVRNRGTIDAPGGRVLLTAAQADAIVTSVVEAGVIEAGGRITADTTARGPGSIQIQSTGGSITIDGSLSAVGRGAGQKGGGVTVATTGAITVNAGATIDASGSAGRGSVAVGTRAGATAKTTTVASGAVILASATTKGRGGQVMILSDRSTTMDGRIAAEGGPRGGAGGTVEVSGHQGFAMTGQVSVTAAAGSAGTILLDPQDLTIRSGGADGGLLQTSGSDGTLAAGNNAGSPVAISAVIDPVVFAGLSGNVVLQAARDLTVQSPITSSAASLSLQAGRNLTVNAPINLSGAGTLTLAAAVSSFASQPGYDPGGPNGVLALSPVGSLNAPLAQVNLSSGVGGFLSSGPIVAGAVTVNVSSTGAFVLGGLIQANTVRVTAGQIALAGSVQATSVQLTTQVGGAIATSGTLTAQSLAVSAGAATFTGSAINVGTLTSVLTSGGFTLLNTGDLLATGTITAGGALTPLASNTSALLLSSTGTLTLGQPGSAAIITAGTVGLVGTGGVFETNGVLYANLLSGTVAGSTVTNSAAATLTGSNAVANFGSMRVTGALAMSTGGALAILGTVSAGGAMTLNAGGALALGSTTQAAALSAGSLRLTAGGAITEPNATITTGTLIAAGNVIALSGANRFGVLGGATASGDIAITDQTAMTIAGPLATSAGSVFVNSGAGGVTIAAPVSAGPGGTIALIGDALTWANPALNPLNASTSGTIALAPSTLGLPITLGGGSGLALASTAGMTAASLQIGAAPSSPGATASTTAGSIAVTGFDAGGIGVLSLNASGAIAQSAALTGVTRLDVAAGSAALTASGNAVPVLGTVVTAGSFNLVNPTGVTVLGLLQAGTVSAPNVANTATARIETPGSIVIGSSSVRSVVNAGTVVLLGGGAITEVNGTIAANALSGPQTGATIATATSVSLRGANTVTTLGGFAATGNIAFVNATGLVIGGAVTAGVVPAPNPANTATISLQAGGDLALGSSSQIAALSAGRIDLLASGAITQPRGILQANTLNGPGQGAAITSATSVNLTGSNLFGVLGNFVASGNIRITNAAGVVISGVISAGPGGGNIAGNTALAELTVLGDLRIGQVGAPSVINAGTVSLLSSGSIVEVSGGIVANQLIGPGPGAAVGQALEADLHGTNIINQIGRFTTSGNFSISDIASVIVVGTLAAGPASMLSITTTGSLTIGQGSTVALISAGTVSIIAAGAIAENPNSSINAKLLTGPFTGLTIPTATDVTLTGINSVAEISQFSASGSLIFRNQRDLAVTGTLSAGSIAAPDPRNSAAVGLIVSGNLALGTASAPAVLNAGTVGLAATGTISEPAGTIVAGLLNDLRLPGAPPTATLIQLDGSNTIAAIGELGARGNITIRNSVPLAVVGTITAGGVQAPSAGNAATVSVSVFGALTIGDATRPGGINAGTVVLMPTGAITEPNGAITASLLLLPATGQSVAKAPAIDLSDRNAISVLAAINAVGDVFINSSTPMTAAGAIVLGAPAPPNAANTTTLTLASASDLAIAANLTAGTISLQSAGALTQSGGVLTANRLSGPAAGLAQVSATSVTLEAANVFAELGVFTSAGNLLLNDTLAVTVSGAVVAGGTALPLAANTSTLRITSGGSITIGNSGQAASLSGGTVTLLTASAIIEGSSGSITTNAFKGPNPTASVASATSVSLLGTNAIASLASVNTVGDFMLANAGPLVVVGTITAGNAGVGGASNIAHLAIGLSAGALSLGSGIDTGVLSAGTIALAAAGGISAPNGRISTTLLSDQTGLAGVPQSASVSLPSPTNSIAALGSLATLSGDLVLGSTGAMTVIGPVNASQRLAVSTTGVMTVLGNVSGAGGVSLSSDLGIQQVSGGITASATGTDLLSLRSDHGSFVQFPAAAITSATSVSITTQGSIGLGASVIAPQGVLSLDSATGGISQSSSAGSKGTVFVQGLSARAAGSIVLDSSSNRIAVVNGVTTPSRFILNTTVPLQITGNVLTGAETTITGTKGVEQVAGSIVAGGVGVQLLSRLGSFTQDRGSYIGATANDGTVSLSALAAGGTIDVGGTISAIGSNALVLLSVPLGGILEIPELAQGAAPVQGAGRIIATRLSASALDSIVLDPVGAANAIGAVDALVSTNGAVGLHNTSSFQINGLAQAANGLRLQSLGDLSLGASAKISVASGATTMRAAGSFLMSAGSTISAPDVTMVAPTSVVISGTIGVPKLSIGGVNGGQSALVLLSDGAVLLTGEASLPISSSPATAWPTYASSVGGTFIATQNLLIGRNVAVRGVTGSASQTLRIDLAGTGVIDQIGGLVAETTTLLVNLGSRANLSGNVSLGGLYIAYPRGSRGAATLSGTVRGVGGQAAAQISSITPGPNALYQIKPIRDFDIRPAHDTVDEAEILLPNVSREDL
ncbi:MAG: filamentous hemagglutinin N-terminal domain-containing protein [Alphaproteobacteria bacterium]|nr:filamentous hemagglutinin N-terminal domain-containing protein [Alphaproteobacteria bacterium]